VFSLGIMKLSQNILGNISDALKDGFSTKGTLGMGLSGVNRLMDEFYFDEKRKKGTKITVKKWI